MLRFENKSMLTELPEGGKATFGMFSFNSPNNSQQFQIDILDSCHVTVTAAAEATQYNAQYLRRCCVLAS